MFIKKYMQVSLLLFLLFNVWSHVKAANQTIATTVIVSSTPTISTTQEQMQSSETVVSPSSIIQSKSITSDQPQNTQQTTKGTTMKEEDKMEPYIIVIIATSGAVFLIAMVMLLLLCIFRRRRSQRLERERNLSYNNMNYESTVKFRADMDGDDATLGSDQTSPRKTSNKPQPDAGYELVDLPNDKKQPNRPQYENVTPQNIKEPKETARPNQQYENVPPMASSENDKPPTSPVGRYEEVFLESPKEKNGDDKKRNDYENVELNV